MKDLYAFITGSRVYGTPRDDSDIDLVVLVSYKDLKMLAELADEFSDITRSSSDPDHAISSGSFRFGNLNLIAVADTNLFEVWRDGTRFLKTKKPVSREKAIKYLKKKRDKIK